MLLELNIAREWAYSKYINKYNEIVKNATGDPTKPMAFSDEDQKLLDGLKERYEKINKVYDSQITNFISVQIDIWKPVLDQKKPSDTQETIK